MPDPAAALADVERVRMRTRMDLQSSWYPMVVFGAVTLGAAAVTGLSTRWVGPYDTVAYIGGCVATTRYYRARALRRGVGDDGRAWLWFNIGFFVTLIAAGSVGNAFGGARAALLAQCAVLGAVYVLLGRLQSSVALGAVGVGTVAVGVALAFADAPLRPALPNVCLGAALVVAGLYELSREESP